MLLNACTKCMIMYSSVRHGVVLDLATGDAFDGRFISCILASRPEMFEFF